MTRAQLLIALTLAASAALAFTFGSPVGPGDAWTAANVGQIQTRLDAMDDCPVGQAVAGAGANIAPTCTAFAASVFGRTGAVVAAQADYDSFFLTPTEGNAAYEPLNALLVDGPAFAFNNNVPRFNGTTGKLIKGSSAAVDDLGHLTSNSFGTAVGDSADAGIIRLANAETICWEASPAGVDVCIAADASEVVRVTGGSIAATTAAALAANPADCSVNQFATTIAASGDLTCAALTDADVPNTITVDLAAAATALAANGANCSAGLVAAGVDAAGAAESCIDPVTQAEGDVRYPQLAAALNTFTGDLTVGGTLTVNCDPAIEDCEDVRAVETAFSVGNAPVSNVKIRYTGSSIVLRDDVGIETTLSSGGTGAPTTANYLVGTADVGLSAEIVVGTVPGGELGGTWAVPTLDDSVTVTGWIMGASTATTPAANDNDTSLATSAYVQGEINGSGGRSLTCASGNCDVDAELFTRTEAFVIDSAAWAVGKLMLSKAPSALTLVQFDCAATGVITPSAQLVTIMECTMGGGTCVSSGLAASVSALETNVSDAVATDAAIDAGDYWGLQMTSATTVADQLHCTARYTVND